LYSVEVVSVNTVFGHTAMVPTGKRRLKTITSKTKKAFVKLKPGQTIVLFDISGAQDKS
jgi:ribosomal protein L23